MKRSPIRLPSTSGHRNAPVETRQMIPPALPAE